MVVSQTVTLPSDEPVDVINTSIATTRNEIKGKRGLYNRGGL